MGFLRHLLQTNPQKSYLTILLDSFIPMLVCRVCFAVYMLNVDEQESKQSDNQNRSHSDANTNGKDIDTVVVRLIFILVKDREEI